MKDNKDVQFMLDKTIADGMALGISPKECQDIAMALMDAAKKADDMRAHSVIATAFKALCSLMAIGHKRRADAPIEWEDN
jgi:hypothetical protein